jgi:hypothetical protein
MFFRRAREVKPGFQERVNTLQAAGFTVNLFADTLQFARVMALAPNGDVFLAEHRLLKRPCAVVVSMMRPMPNWTTKAAMKTVFGVR